MSARSYRIGEVAAATGVTVGTLRYYEREGLLSVALRTSSGARRYGHETVERVRFIKQAQAVGLTLKDVHILVASRQKGSRTACQRTRRILATRIGEIEDRVQDLQAFREVLQEHLRACDRALADQTIQDCPTLDAIGRGEAQALEGTRP